MAEGKSFYRGAMVTLVALHLAFDVYKYRTDPNLLYNEITRYDSIAMNPTTKTAGVADFPTDGNSASRSLGVTFTVVENDNNELIAPSQNPSVGSLESLEAEILAETVETVEEGGAVNLDPQEGEDTTMGPKGVMSVPPTGCGNDDNSNPCYEDSWDSGIRTNFDYKVAFNFSYIFFIGGVCNGAAPDNWYSKFVAAGSATINITDTICYEYDPNDPEDDPHYVYSRDFHLFGLEEVVRRVGDKLNETLVITVAVGLESDWTPVADLMKNGMAFWHAKEDPNSFLLEDYGLVPEDVLYFYFRWDEERAAYHLGKELCRLRKEAPSLKYGQLWTHVRNNTFNFRTEMAIRAFKEKCPHTKLENVWNLYSDQEAAYKTTLMFNPYPDIVLATADEIAADILQVAKDIYPNSTYNKMAAIGWNNDIYGKSLLQEGKMLMTVDQGVHHPKRGLWRVISTVLEVAQDFGLNSTAAIQKEMNIGGTTILADTLLIAGDQEGHLIDKLLQGYDSKSTGMTKKLQVSTGVWNTTIAQMDPFEGKFEAIFIRVESWVDPRLEWDPFLESYEGTLTIDRESIWTPGGMYFPNEIGFDDATVLHASPAVVSSNGTVIMYTSLHAMFLCETIEELRRYPFESYECAMALRGPKGTTLDTSLGFNVTQIDPHFKTSVSAGQGNGNQIVNFQLTFVRRPFGVYVSVILPGIVINMIGFMAFWIPGLEHQVALAIAALLCALTYRTALEIPDIATVTWVEIFMMINTAYLFAVMIIIWFSFGSSSIMGHYINKCCKPVIHPRNVAREAKAKLDASGITASGETASVLGHPTRLPKVSFEDAVPIDDAGTQSAAATSGKTSFVTTQDQSANSIDYGCREQSSHSSNTDQNPSELDLMPQGPLAIRPPTLPKNENRREKVARKLKRFVSERIFETNEASEADSEWQHANLDWIGRWFIVPSYFIMVSSLLIGGWGYK